MSTLEIVIAFALIIIAIVGGVDASYSAQYWSLASLTSNEGLYKAKTVLETIRANASFDFQSASSSPLTASKNQNDAADKSCIAGGLCYFTGTFVTDYSTCAKFAEARVAWDVSQRYPTTTTSLFSNLTNDAEIIALGGDCLLARPAGSWTTASPSIVGSVSLGGEYTTGIDVLQKKIYVTASSTNISARQLRIYSTPQALGQSPTLLGSTPGSTLRLNAVDAVRDESTGRLYVYAAQHATSSQLAVFDATDSANPTLVTTRGLSGVDPLGSYPQGWRVFAYGSRLYVTTRETAGPELHIFDISQPTQPTEIVSAATELTRTVNALVVRNEIVNGATRRFLYLAASAGLKELSVLDVTGDTPVEKVAVNLSNTQDALSLSLIGNRLYVGRQLTSGGPELFVFDTKQLQAGNTTPLGSAKVGGDVAAIRAVGDVLFLATSVAGAEFEVRASDYTKWSTTNAATGRYSTTAFTNLAPQSLDVEGDYVYGASRNFGGAETLTTFYTP